MNTVADTVRSANHWRQNYNPLRGLTIARVINLLEAGERGEFADLQWLYRFIERTDATIGACVARRVSAIKKLDWDIKQASGTGIDEKLAARQAEFLRKRYEQIENLRQAVQFLALAEFRGFAHLEKHWSDSLGGIKRLEPVEQWFWVRRGLYGDWQYNADARQSSQGTPIKPENFLIRECLPKHRVNAIAYLRKNMSQKDWDGYIEVYGIPPIFIIGPPGGGTKQELDKYFEIAQQVVSDGRGFLPNGADVKSLDGGKSGPNPFRDHISYQDEQIVLMATGGKLTMLSSPTGIGSGPSEQHEDTFAELAQAEAAEISELFQTDLDKPWLTAAFPGQPILAYWQLAAEDTEDVNAIVDRTLKLSQAGYSVDIEELSEKVGLKLTPKSDATPAAPAPGDRPPLPSLKNRAAAPAVTTPDPGLLENALADALGVIPKWLAPVADLLAKIERKASDATIADADLAAFVEKAARNLPDLLGRLDVNALAGVIEAALGTSAVAGLSDSLKARS